MFTIFVKSTQWDITTTWWYDILEFSHLALILYLIVYIGIQQSLYNDLHMQILCWTLLSLLRFNKVGSGTSLQTNPVESFQKCFNVEQEVCNGNVWKRVKTCETYHSNQFTKWTFFSCWLQIICFCNFCNPVLSLFDTKSLYINYDQNNLISLLF